MATFLNMFKKIAGFCRPVQTYQFHTRWQSIPHTLLAISGVPCKTAVRPWSCWGRTGNFSPGHQCVTPPLQTHFSGFIFTTYIPTISNALHHYSIMNVPSILTVFWFLSLPKTGGHFSHTNFHVLTLQRPLFK